MTASREQEPVLAPRSRSRRKILGAALQAFSRRGFHETKMDEIASLAGVAKGTLYYNFPSKSDLFAALVSEGMDRFIETLDKEIVSDLPFPDHFRRLVGVHVDLLLEWRDLFVIAANPTAHGFDPETVERVEAARDRYVDHVADMVRQGQDQGYLRPCDPDLMASQFLGLLDGLLRHQRRARSPILRDRLADELHALLAGGLLAERPVARRPGARRGARRGEGR